MGAFYKNEDQTLYVKRDIGDSVALCQCVAQELGHAELSMNSEVYSRRDMGFQAVDVYKRQEHMDTIRDSIETRANDVLKRDKNRESR